MKKYATFIALLACAGCCKKPEPVVIKVPIPIESPRVEVPPRPVLPVVQEGDTVEVACQKMAAALILVVDYSMKLETLIKPFAKAPVDARPERLPDQPRNTERSLASNSEIPGRGKN